MGLPYDSLFDADAEDDDAIHAFDPLAPDDQDEYDNPDAMGSLQRTKFTGLDPELARRVIAETQKKAPEARSLSGFVDNLSSDVLSFGGDVASLISSGIANIPSAPGALVHAVTNPLETLDKAQKLGGAVIQSYADRYGRRGDEDYLQAFGREAYEHPFQTLMDVSSVLQAPAGAAKLLGSSVKAFDKAAEFGRALDPLTIAHDTLKPIAKSLIPDATARYIASSAAADAVGGLKKENRFNDRKFNDALHNPESGVFAELNNAEKAAFFPYAEGRLQLLPDSGIPSRAAGEPLRKEALDQALQRYVPIQQEWDRAMNLLPEQAVEIKLGAAKKQLEKAGWDIESPESQSWLQAQAEDAAKEAQEQYNLRRTVSTRTLLDEAKQATYQKQLNGLVADGIADSVTDAASLIPRPVKPTAAEALELMGPDGGVIMPHSMEVFTRDQATVGNVLGKVKEASIWKNNEGKMFKEGLLDQYDPERALWAAHYQISRGKTLGTVAQEIVDQLRPEGLAEELGKGYNKLTDPELVNGSHQLMGPGYLHMQDLLRGQYQNFLARVLEVGDDAAVRELNLPDLTDSFLKGQSSLFKLKPELQGKVYKIPKGAGDAYAAFERSLHPQTDIVSQISDSMLGPWNFSNLNLFGTRVANDAVGNTITGMIQGVHPFSIQGMDSLITAGKAMRGHLAPEGASALEKRLSKVLELPGVSGAGVSGAARDSMGWFGDWLNDSPNPLLRGVGKWGKTMQKVNENIDDFWRAASTIYELKNVERDGIKGMAQSTAALEHFADRVEELSGRGLDVIDDADYKHVMKAVNKYYADYDRSTATSRLVLRHVMPYHKFYQHAARMFFKFPFDKPLKGQMARELGKRAQNDVKETLASWGFDWNTMVPQHMRTGVPISVETGPDGSPSVMMLNSTGQNPFNMFSGDDLGHANLGALHPLLKLAYEQVTGVNMFTGERFNGPFSAAANREVDPVTHDVKERVTRPNLFEHFLRQFRVYGTAKDLVAAGRQPTDTATILDMLDEGNHDAWQLDARGFPRRRPQPFGSLTPLVRTVGATPQVLQAPTEQQIRSRRGEMATMFSDVFQRNPELQQFMLEQMDKFSQEERPDPVPITPRRF